MVYSENGVADVSDQSPPLSNTAPTEQLAMQVPPQQLFSSPEVNIIHMIQALGLTEFSMFSLRYLSRSPYLEESHQGVVPVFENAHILLSGRNSKRHVNLN